MAPGGGACDDNTGPGEGPGGPDQQGQGGKTTTIGGHDPNDIAGPAGFGSEHIVRIEPVMPFKIRFENMEDATAPAQEVFVTHTLDADLDMATFELGDIGFGPIVVDVPGGVQVFATSVAFQNLDGSPLTVDLSAELDVETRTVTWAFRSVDPNTGLFPPGVFDGFLPPNDETGRGDGFVQYTIWPLPGLHTGITIDQQASIVFDINDPILTNVFTNTIDVGLPASSVDPLPATTDTASFEVSWTGTDDADGSPGAGINFFDIYVSDDGAPFAIWEEQTSETSATYNGVDGHMYQFYSIATDGVGFVEAPPLTFDTETTVEAAVLAADFNSDGAVNGDDFLIWQTGFGITDGAGRTDGDADADGDVDGDDFLLWQAQFGSGGGAGAGGAGAPVGSVLSGTIVSDPLTPIVSIAIESAPAGSKRLFDWNRDPSRPIVDRFRSHEWDNWIAPVADRRGAGDLAVSRQSPSREYAADRAMFEFGTRDTRFRKSVRMERAVLENDLLGELAIPLQSERGIRPSLRSGSVESDCWSSGFSLPEVGLAMQPASAGRRHAKA